MDVHQEKKVTLSVQKSINIKEAKMLNIILYFPNISNFLKINTSLYLIIYSENLNVFSAACESQG